MYDNKGKGEEIHLRNASSTLFPIPRKDMAQDIKLAFSQESNSDAWSSNPPRYTFYRLRKQIKYLLVKFKGLSPGSMC